jgi:hypothetical protein
MKNDEDPDPPAGQVRDHVHPPQRTRWVEREHRALRAPGQEGFVARAGRAGIGEDHVPGDVEIPVVRPERAALTSPRELEHLS